MPASLAPSPAAPPAAFADCPRCGGWARLAPRGRAKCRGCQWSGVAPPAATTALG